MLEEEREYKEAVHHLFMDFKNSYDLARREVLNNITIESGIPKNL
jgi:hypothetical protein